MRGDMLPITPGLGCAPVEHRGRAAERDRSANHRLVQPFLPVGFYYKAFHTPRRLFRFYEGPDAENRRLGQDRRAGEAWPAVAEGLCVLRFVGGRRRAGRNVRARSLRRSTGLHVMLVDEQPRPGGSLRGNGQAMQRSREQSGGWIGRDSKPDNWKCVAAHKREAGMPITGSHSSTTAGSPSCAQSHADCRGLHRTTGRFLQQ